MHATRRTGIDFAHRTSYQTQNFSLNLHVSHERATSRTHPERKNAQILLPEPNQSRSIGKIPNSDTGNGTKLPRNLPVQIRSSCRETTGEVKPQYDSCVSLPWCVFVCACMPARCDGVRRGAGAGAGASVVWFFKWCLPALCAPMGGRPKSGGPASLQ